MNSGDNTTYEPGGYCWMTTGIDGKLYVVWPNSYEREQYMARDNRYDRNPIASCGQFENAVCIG